MKTIANRRKENYEFYQQELTALASENNIGLPAIPAECQSNYHMFYLIIESNLVRDQLLGHLRDGNIKAVFHYVPLHSSPVAQKNGYYQKELPNTDELSARLLRLPLYLDISPAEQSCVVDTLCKFFEALTGTRRT